MLPAGADVPLRYSSPRARAEHAAEVQAIRAAEAAFPPGATTATCARCGWVGTLKWIIFSQREQRLQCLDTKGCRRRRIWARRRARRGGQP